MANSIEILINAKDQASATIEKTSINLGGLAKAAAAGALAVSGLALTLQAAASASIGFAKGFASEVEQLDRLRYVTGLTNEQLQVFRRGLERNGLQADQLGIALRYFQSQLSTNRKELANYGITSTNTFDALVQLKRALEGAGDETERTELASKTLGLRNVELAQTVTDVAGNYANELNVAMSRGAVVGGQAEDQFRALDTTLDDLGDTFRSLKKDTAEFFSPLIILGAAAIEIANKLRIAVAAAVEREYNPGVVTTANAVASAARSGGPQRGDSALFDRASFDAANKQRAANAAGFGVVDGLGQFESTGGPALSQRSNVTANLMQLGKVLETVEVPALKLTDAGEKMNDSMLRLEANILQVAANIESSVSAAMFNVLTGVQTIGSAFRSLMMNIMSAIADAVAQYLAKLATGAAISFIGSLIPGPVGWAIRGAGGAISGSNSVAPGGNTYFIQSIDTKSVLDSLVSPTGSMRRAGDRVSEIAMAGAL